MILLGDNMKMSSILFESKEVQQEKVLHVEKDNIKSLQKTHDEIQEMLEALIPKEAKEVLVENPFENRFPVDHRIIKKVS